MQTNQLDLTKFTQSSKSFEESYFLSTSQIYLVFQLLMVSSLQILKLLKLYLLIKKSKLEFSNHKIISILYNLDKSLEKPMHNSLFNFLEKQYYLSSSIWL